jgi:hypothetical protein
VAQGPAYVEAYEALEEEFALADALIRARSEADMTQEQWHAQWAPHRPRWRVWRAGAPCHLLGHFDATQRRQGRGYAFDLNAKVKASGSYN